MTNGNVSSNNDNVKSNEPLASNSSSSPSLSQDVSDNKGVGNKGSSNGDVQDFQGLVKDGVNNARSYDQADNKGNGNSLNNLARRVDGATKGLNNLSKGLGAASNGVDEIGKKIEAVKQKSANRNNSNSNNSNVVKEGASKGSNSDDKSGLAKGLDNASKKAGGVADKIGGINSKLQMANNLNNIKNDPSVAKDVAVDVVKKAVVKKVISVILPLLSGCFPVLLLFFIIIFIIVLIIFVVGSTIDSSANDSSSYSGSGICSYNVNGVAISDIKVRLLECDGSAPIEGEELVDFEKYILGVTYAEHEDGVYESFKAQAIAARSYSLTRAKVMNGSGGVKLEEEDGQWILSIRSCTNDQVYCDPDKGCWNHGSSGSTHHSGTDVENGGKVYKGVLSQDSKIRQAVKETEGQVLLDSNGNIVITSYIDTNQNYWKSLAKDGKDAFEILMADYGSQDAAKIGTPECEQPSYEISNADIQTLIKMSDSEAWKELVGFNAANYPPEVSESSIGSRMVFITVPMRKWDDSGGTDPQKNTKMVKQQIQVNAALADLWLAFFTDVYNEATDFVIGSFDGCYVYKRTNGTLSAHAYGAACDINASTSGNGLGTTSYSKEKWETLPESRSKYQIVYKGSKVVEIAHRYTLINGSDWYSSNDAMHFSFIRDWTRSAAQACQDKIYCK